MSSKATVSTQGAILLGNYVACDAFDEAKPLRVVTHAHSDHMLGLKKSLKSCETVLMTPTTKDLVDVLKGPLFLMIGKVETLGYDEPLAYEEEQIRFYSADHIPGSAQVLVEEEGTRILYRGTSASPALPSSKPTF